VAILAQEAGIMASKEQIDKLVALLKPAVEAYQNAEGALSPIAEFESALSKKPSDTRRWPILRESVIKLAHDTVMESTEDEHLYTDLAKHIIRQAEQR
jgi:hypothetical protein